MNARYFSITHAHPGTCDWLFETSEFQTWRDQADSADGNRALWIKGEPGSGKSTTMKHTLEYCQKEFTNHSIISYFFESRGCSLEKTTLGMLQSLVSQLLHQNDQLRNVFFEFFRGKLRTQDQSDWQWFQVELEKFLRLAIQQPSAKPLIILIDAIDECGELEVQSGFSFLEGLLYLSYEKDVAFKLCVSSCSWFSIDAKQETISLALPDRHEHLRDISLYLEDKSLSSNHDVKDTILNGCKGSFLWVVLVVATLNRSHAEGQDECARKRLEGELASINGVLHAVLKPGDESCKHKSAERTLLLQLVLLSKRPIRLEEACAATGIVPADTETSERYIIDLSEGLIVVQEYQNGDVFVRSIHNMVNDYLLSEERLQMLSPELGDHPIHASHGCLWMCCLEYLQSSIVLIENSTTEQDIRGMSFSHPFLSYAADYMLYHAEMAWDATPYREQIELWLKQQASWFIHMKKHRNIEEGLGLLHVVILDGLPNLTRVLLVPMVGAMAYSEKRDTLQAIAFTGGQPDMLKILLDHGANMDDQMGEHGSALHAALRGGDKKVVRFLLENSANLSLVSTWDSDFEVALKTGNPEIIETILKFGFKKFRMFFSTVLQAAVAMAGDNEEAVSLLVNRGADVNAAGGFHGNALQGAVFKNSERIIQLLIDEGADINASGGRYGSALQTAAASGNAEITKLLIEQGADTNASGGYYGNALQAAAYQGNLEVLNLLLSHDTDIEAEGGEFGNALCAASDKGNLEVVKVLLERGANPNAQAGYHGSPLHTAVVSLFCRLDVVKLLVARGSDINAEGGEYGNALCAALAMSRSEIVMYLLENGARTDLRDSFKCTALHYAVKTSSVQMVQELLSRGAPQDEVDDAQATPLDVAIQNRKSDMVHLLLRHASHMPTLSASDWRDRLRWGSNCYMEVCTSQPRHIKKHDKKLPEFLVDQFLPVIPPDKEGMGPWKTGRLIASMSKANV